MLWIAIIAGAIFLDQITKWLIVTYLPDGGVSLIPGVFRFTYVENTGAAFGMLSDNRWVFIIISSVALLGMFIYLVKWKPKSRLLSCAFAFIIGGGIGNMIDRVMLGYVVDFLDFCAFPNLWMWVFNVADAFVCVGAGLMMLYLIKSTLEEIKVSKAQKAQAQTAGAETQSANTATSIESEEAKSTTGAEEIPPASEENEND